MMQARRPAPRPQALAATPTRPSSSAVSAVTFPVPSNRARTEGAIEKEFDGSPDLPGRRLPSAPADSPARAGSRSKPHPPGRTSPRPKRLPQRAAVMFRNPPAAVRRRRRSAENRRRRPAPRHPRRGWRAAPAPGRWPEAASARGDGATAGQGLDGLAIGRHVSDGGVPGGRLHLVRSGRMGAGRQATAPAPRCW